MLNEGPDQLEMQTSQKAAASGQTQNNKLRIQRQKDQMSQKMSPTVKSDVTYASEEYFQNLRDRVELRRAQDEARMDWRKDLEEAAIERPQDEGNHPYVSVMPHTKKLPPKVHGNTKMENRPQQQQESISFCEEFDNLVNEGLETGEEYHKRMAKKAKDNPINPHPVKAKDWKPGDHIRARAKQMAAAPKKKDTRTDSEKMADAYASPRKGPGGAVRAD